MNGITDVDLASVRVLPLLTIHAATSSTAYCTSHGWSMVASAATNSSFAGILAGLVFTSVTILITRSGPRNTQALGLLSCGFVVLGFDSYLFSLVNGSASDTDCHRVWAEGIPASGMLAVGGAAVVTGISWLLAEQSFEGGVSGHPGAGSEQSKQGSAGLPGVVIRLDSLSRVMAHGVAFAVALLLASTIYDYEKFAFNGRDSTELTVLGIVSTLIVLIASLALTSYRKHSPESAMAALLATVAFRLASYGVLGYALVSTIFVGYITNLSAGQPVWAVLTIILGLVVPSILLIALVQSVAPPILGKDRETVGSFTKVQKWLVQRRAKLAGQPCASLSDSLNVENIQTSDRAPLDSDG
jgi:hypothetical protein